MADGAFPGLVSKDRDVNATGNPIYVQLSDGTSAIDVTSGALDVNVDNNVTVTASDLDIRDLTQVSDSILIYGNTAKDGSGTSYVPLLDADGKVIISNPGGTEYTEDVASPATIVGTATMMERDDALAALTPVEGDWVSLRSNSVGALWVAVNGEVAINDGGNTITVDGTVAATQSGTWTVDLGATDNAVLDAIAASLVDIETNTDFGAVVGGGVEATALRVTIASDSTGTLTVDASDLDIRDLTHVSDSVSIGDGTETLNITAAGEAEVDIAAQSLTALKISKDANANSETNPIYVQEVKQAASGNEVHDYDTGTAVASDATDNHDYTAVGTFFLKSVIIAGSGNIKAEIINDATGTPATVAVAFLNGRQGDTQQVVFDPPVEVATGDVLRVVRTNRQGAAVDVYSTIMGYDV